MVALDAMTGFRFELFWPAWLMIRAAVESIQMKNQHCVTTISNPSAARFSILFVCVTATSDLICYLFIPIRVLIFLATTFVWLNLFYHTQGGFLRAMATIYSGERIQSWPIVFITCFIVTFELFLRIRSHPILISFFPNVTEWTGVSPVWPRSLNAFFGAHSLGYPAILITVSLHYYLNEWKLRRKQGDVSTRNEQLFRILVESLPAEYEGPKDYTSQQCLEDGNDLYYLDPPVQTTQPMQAILAGPTANSTPPASSKKNGIHKRNGDVHSSMTSSKKKKNGSAYNSTPPNDKKKSKSLRDADFDDVDDSEADDYSWRDQSGSEDQRKSGGISIIRIIFGTAWWMVSSLFVGSSSTENSSANRLEDDEEEEENEVDKKNGRTDSLTNSTATTTTTKARANTLPSTARSHVNNNNNHSQKHQHHKQSNGKSHQNHHQKTNGNANGHARSSAAVRDSSHDTNASNDNDIRSMTRELESLRSEISSHRISEEDYKLQISILETNVTSYAQSLQNTQTKIEQLEKKILSLEKNKETEKHQLDQSEKRYAELLGKKAEIEATLSAERKARMESTSKKYDVAEHQRERERQLESEIDKLRSDLRSKEETNKQMESELHELRNYKEDNDIETLHMELRLARDKSSQMEESLAGENKLKQSLFKCLGDARDRIKSLEHENKEIKLKNGSVSGSSETLMNGRSSTEANNENDTFQTASDQSSPHQHSAMGSPIPFAKMPLTVNVSNRHGSPFSEKLSPIASIGSVMGGVPAPPDYMMAVGASAAATVVAQKQQAAFSSIRYNEFTHMPTGGEHRLFDTPNSISSATSPNGTNPEDEFLMNKGKFGAPAQPTARLA
uniref:Macoilin n=1 Tax=Caenorhabditis tropicalis TaxID=1561998 RepID=A0A1I7U463_9PELO